MMKLQPWLLSSALGVSRKRRRVLHEEVDETLLAVERERPQRLHVQLAVDGEPYSANVLRVCIAKSRCYALICAVARK